MSLLLDLTKLKEVPFEPVQEPWNEYRLKDGSLLRVRLIVVKFFDTGEIDPSSGCPRYVVAYRNILSVVSEERGSPRPAPADLSKIPDSDKEEVEVEEILKEDWNIYHVDGVYEHRAKPVIVAVYRLKGYFDPAGYPIYNVETRVIDRTRKLKR